MHRTLALLLLSSLVLLGNSFAGGTMRGTLQAVLYKNRAPIAATDGPWSKTGGGEVPIECTVLDTNDPRPSQALSCLWFEVQDLNGVCTGFDDPLSCNTNVNVLNGSGTCTLRCFGSDGQLSDQADGIVTVTSDAGSTCEACDYGFPIALDFASDPFGTSIFDGPWDGSAFSHVGDDLRAVSTGADTSTVRSSVFVDEAHDESNYCDMVEFSGVTPPSSGDWKYSIGIRYDTEVSPLALYLLSFGETSGTNFIAWEFYDGTFTILEQNTSITLPATGDYLWFCIDGIGDATTLAYGLDSTEPGADYESWTFDDTFTANPASPVDTGTYTLFRLYAASDPNIVIDLDEYGGASLAAEPVVENPVLEATTGNIGWNVEEGQFPTQSEACFRNSGEGTSASGMDGTISLVGVGNAPGCGTGWLSLAGDTTFSNLTAGGAEACVDVIPQTGSCTETSPNVQATIRASCTDAGSETCPADVDRTVTLNVDSTPPPGGDFTIDFDVVKQTNCYSPCGVFLDAIANRDNPNTDDPNTSNEFHDLHFQWDFTAGAGDEAADLNDGDTYDYGGVNAGVPLDEPFGPMAAFVYEIADGGGNHTFTVRLTATNAATSESATTTKTVQVLDATGLTTTCLTQAGSSPGGCPSGGTELTNQTASSIEGLIESRPGERILLNGGETWTSSGAINPGGGTMVGVYNPGSGKPKIKFTSDTPGFTISVDNVSIYGLELEGPGGGADGAWTINIPEGQYGYGLIYDVKGTTKTWHRGINRNTVPSDTTPYDPWVFSKLDMQGYGAGFTGGTNSAGNIINARFAHNAVINSIFKNVSEGGTNGGEHIVRVYNCSESCLYFGNEFGLGRSKKNVISLRQGGQFPGNLWAFINNFLDCTQAAGCTQFSAGVCGSCPDPTINDILIEANYAEAEGDKEMFSSSDFGNRVTFRNNACHAKTGIGGAGAGNCIKMNNSSHVAFNNAFYAEGDGGSTVSCIRMDGASATARNNITYMPNDAQAAECKDCGNGTETNNVVATSNPWQIADPDNIDGLEDFLLDSGGSEYGSLNEQGFSNYSIEPRLPVKDFEGDTHGATLDIGPDATPPGGDFTSAFATESAPSCYSPCGAFFDSIQDVDNPLTDTGLGKDFHILDVDWDFDSTSTGSDTNTGLYSTGRQNYNKEAPNGPQAAHVFEIAEGGGNVTFTVRADFTSPNGDTSTATDTLQVLDPSGMTTTCVTQDSDASACPDADETLTSQSASAIQSIIEAREGNRILLKRGQTWTASSRILLDAGGTHIGAFGSGAKPVIDYSGSDGFRIEGDDIAIYDVELDGPATGSGASKPIAFNVEGDADNLLIFRTKLAPNTWHRGYNHGAGVPSDPPVGIVISENEWVSLGADAWGGGNSGGNILIAHLWRSAIIGNRIGDTVDGNGPGSTGEHNIRIPWCKGSCLIAHNTLGPEPSGRVTLSVRAADQSTSRLIQISDNRFECGFDTCTSMVTANNSAHTNVNGRDVLWERNFGMNSPDVSSTTDLLSKFGSERNTQRVTARNNLAHFTTAANLFETGDVQDAWFIGNSLYKSGSNAFESPMIKISGHGSVIACKGNLMYAPNHAASVVCSSGEDDGNNHKASSNPFTIADPDNIDEAGDMQVSSPNASIIDAGVCASSDSHAPQTDAFGTSRPQGGGCDIGAHEQ